ncbi:HAD hydrolase family protein [Nostoc ellipsosporum NOK]|nr:HAD hydrolase family protein [Nostoc ellipsosporum NOK]
MAAISFSSISCFVFDVDGVLTDGTVLVLENGLQARRMSIKDGFALQLAVKKGYKMLILSGAAVSPVVDRLQKLGVTDIQMGITDKAAFLENYLRHENIPASSVLFMGDDLPDIGVMNLVGIAACPADAAPEVKEVATYISGINGGMGCAREVIREVLKARGDWTSEAGVASR